MWCWDICLNKEISRIVYYLFELINEKYWTWKIKVEQENALEVSTKGFIRSFAELLAHWANGNKKGNSTHYMFWPHNLYTRLVQFCSACTFLAIQNSAQLSLMIRNRLDFKIDTKTMTREEKMRTLVCCEFKCSNDVCFDRWTTQTQQHSTTQHNTNAITAKCCVYVCCRQMLRQWLWAVYVCYKFIQFY